MNRSNFLAPHVRAAIQLKPGPVQPATARHVAAAIQACRPPGADLRSAPVGAPPARLPAPGAPPVARPQPSGVRPPVHKPPAVRPTAMPRSALRPPATRIAQPKEAPSTAQARPVPKPSAPSFPHSPGTIQRSRSSAISDQGSYKGHDCGFSSKFTGDFRKKDNYYVGRSIKRGTKLYHGTGGKSKWWEEGPPQSLTRDGPFFSTSLSHSKTLAGSDGVLLEYTVKNDFPLAFTGGRGGYEVMEEMLGKEMGYYSTKECELAVRNNRVADLVDWKSVKVVGPGFLSTVGSYLWWGLSGIGTLFTGCYRGCSRCASNAKSYCCSSKEPVLPI
jgi:hypothetical protein